MQNSKKYIDSLFSAEKTIKETAKAKTFRRELCRYNPGGMGGSIMGRYPRMATPAMKAALWGSGGNLTLSLLKTDVVDRRYVDKDHFTMADLIEGAFSEKNKDINDMPLAGMTRPPFAVLHKDGGRYNHALWSEVYPFPCQKSVGQIIVKADELMEAEQPVAEQHMKDGSVTVKVEKDGKSIDVNYIFGMKRNIAAVDLSYENMDEPVAFRLYRNVDQGHRRYMEENGEYKKVVVYRPADADQSYEYYDFEADREINGLFEPPATGREGRFFWVHQVFPSDTTFPEGFRYVMMGLVSNAEAEVDENQLAKGLGTAPYIPRDGQGMLKVPGIRTMTHPELFELMEENYSHVAKAPGVAVTARLKNSDSGKARLYVAVVTVNETADYMQKAKDMLLEAERIGFEGIAAENEAWYDALYEKRENGRIIMGGTEEEKCFAADIFTDEVYQSWTSGHMGYCNPDPAKLEGGASYAGYDIDIQNWHTSPCYNELFTEGKYFMRNQYEPKMLWPRLISLWHETFKEKARLKFGLPGMCMAHGFLPPAAQSPWYMENNSLDFSMEVPGQIMKVIWNFWDYAADEKFLKNTAYPILRDLAIFYEAFARMGWDGKQFNIEPTVETESYGVSYRLEYTCNNTGALTMFRKVLNIAAEAAEYLGLDSELIPGWLEVAEKLAPYPKFRVIGGDIMGSNEKAFPRHTRGDHYMFNGYNPVNLSDEINLDSPQELKELMVRTADVVCAARNWDPYILTGASKEYIPCRYAKGAVKIENHNMLAEDLLEAPERLMNSRSGRIHLFPAVPDWTVAAFRGFLARGGFEVSAARNEEGVQAVMIKARRSIPCRLMNPWTGSNVAAEDVDTGILADVTMDLSNGECIIFNAVQGHVYNIYRKNN
ncbi:glycosyl hydrolase family 95 catalytic domain-containing protein [Ruminiclostridium cellobioparum]|uniref:Uncharacterized protein n=1 Tax=Ruminiclostridium cellobioparum subsp. termitidis CT1112 TaxID=1195236 RepID=S0FFD0_RUMCE|nr:hypothetical protein [Ruminiclostridium cellobioparum]EMS69177.1 hypothetical protein CTER_5306 [Ruminiclostridium cellobioparum subsp. termitidis CT1112]